jgi:hypothetical protein
MTVKELINYFGSLYRVSLSCNLSMGAPYAWKKRGYIPINAQIKIEKLTGGALKASLNDLKGVENDY